MYLSPTVLNSFTIDNDCLCVKIVQNLQSFLLFRYADMLDQKTGEIEEDKKRALRDMMEKLADEIVQKKTALREKQLAEVILFII